MAPATVGQSTCSRKARATGSIGTKSHRWEPRRRSLSIIRSVPLRTGAQSCPIRIVSAVRGVPPRSQWYRPDTAG